MHAACNCLFAIVINKVSIFNLSFGTWLWKKLKKEMSFKFQRVMRKIKELSFNVKYGRWHEGIIRVFHDLIFAKI